MSKPRVIKDFEKLDPIIQEQIKMSYPHGFSRHLISFRNKDGRQVSALPFETDEKYYLVRMTVVEAREIIRQDEDYDDEGVLKIDVMEDYQDKYEDVEYLKDEDTEEEVFEGSDVKDEFGDAAESDNDLEEDDED